MRVPHSCHSFSQSSSEVAKLFQFYSWTTEVQSHCSPNLQRDLSCWFPYRNANSALSGPMPATKAPVQAQCGLLVHSQLYVVHSQLWWDTSYPPCWLGGNRPVRCPGWGRTAGPGDTSPVWCGVCRPCPPAWVWFVFLCKRKKMFVSGRKTEVSKATWVLLGSGSFMAIE